jgi:hypothetical protein
VGEIVVPCLPKLCTSLQVSGQLQVPAVLIPEKLNKRSNVSLSFS